MGIVETREKWYVQGQEAYENGMYMEALRLWVRSANIGCAEAMYGIANLYYYGEGVSADIVQAQSWARKAVDAGFEDVNDILALSTEDADDIDEIDLHEAEGVEETSMTASAPEPMQEIEEQSDNIMKVICDIPDPSMITPDMISEAESLYEQGKQAFARKAFAQTKNLLTEAAKLGNADAMNELADLYYYGYGVEKDNGAAFAWCKKAAEFGNPSGMNNLAYMYKFGRGVEADPELSTQWYIKAAHAGNAKAQNNLGNAYAEGIGVEVDLEEAAQWYHQAADQGNRIAQYNLGMAYKNGAGVEQDDKLEMQYLKLSADAGYAKAQYEYGKELFDFRRYEESEKYLLEVCGVTKPDHADYLEGQLILAKMYEAQMVQSEYQLSKMWRYRLAADNGNVEGMMGFVRVCAASPTLSSRAAQDAMDYVDKLVAAGHEFYEAYIPILEERLEKAEL